MYATYILECASENLFKDTLNRKALAWEYVILIFRSIALNANIAFI